MTRAAGEAEHEYEHGNQFGTAILVIVLRTRLGLPPSGSKHGARLVLDMWVIFEDFRGVVEQRCGPIAKVWPVGG